MGHKYFLLCRNFLNLDSGEILAMPQGALILLFALELKDDGLGAAAMGQNGSDDAGALGGRAGLDAIAVHEGEHSAHFDLGPGFACERFDLNGLARGDAVLLAARLDYCVHGSSSSRFSYL